LSGGSSAARAASPYSGAPPIVAKATSACSKPVLLASVRA
jgi:hypothetical protein